MSPRVFRYYYAGRNDIYCYAGIDDKMWNLRMLNSINGGVEIPSRRRVRVAIPSQLGQLLNNVAVGATAHMDGATHGLEIERCVDTAVNRFLADWDGLSALADITPREEAELRRAHEVGEDYPVASLFRDKLFAMPEVFLEWDPKKTIVRRDIVKRITTISFRDSQGIYLMGVHFTDHD